MRMGATLVLGAACAGRADAPAHTSAVASSATEPLPSSATGSASTHERDSSESTSEPKERESGPKTGLQALAVAGFENAAVVVPTDPRPVPVLVATHGAGGDSAWECERWARVARERWFLVCPSGTPFRRGEAAYFYRDHHALEREVVASVGAARAKYGARITKDGGVYVGYSQGATMGALMLVDHGSEFSHLLLIEGGSGDWTLARSQRFRATGGKSVFIVCGTPACEKRATRSQPVLERAGLHAEVRALSGGHTELGEVGAAAEKLLETLAGR